MVVDGVMQDYQTVNGELESSAVDAMLKLSGVYSDSQHQLERGRTMSMNDSYSSDDMRQRSSSFSSKDRAERAFVPDNKKDEHYWMKRKKNNEAAKRSREKRKMMDMATTDKVVHLSNINNELSDELRAIKEYFGLPVNKPFSPSNVAMNKTVPEKGYFAPQVPAIPLAAMASFMQQQLVTQANMGHVSMPTVDTKPMVNSNGCINTPPSPDRQIQLPPVSLFTNSNTRQDPIKLSNNRYMERQYREQLNEMPVSKKPKHNEGSYIDLSEEEGTSKVDNWNVSGANDSGSSSDQRACNSSNSSTSGDTQTTDLDIPSNPQKGIPFKLRHKHMYFSQLMNGLDNGLENQDVKEESSGSGAISSSIENVPAILHDVESDDSSSYVEDSDGLQHHHSSSYTDRRKRNNMAARKCRENKKYLLQIREAQSEYLELENKKLKDELTLLSHEVRGLKDLMHDKQAAEQQGRRFVPPPIDLLHKTIHDNKH